MRNVSPLKDQWSRFSTECHTSHCIHYFYIILRLLKNLWSQKWSLSSQCRSVYLIFFFFSMFLLQLWLLSCRMMPAIFSKLFFVSCLALPYEVAALFKWNLCRLPFLWQAVNLHLLLCTGFYKMFLYTYALFLLRDKWMIGRMTVRAAMSSGYASVCWWSWILISPWTLAVVLCCSCLGIARYKWL